MGLIQRYKAWREYENRAHDLEQLLLEARVGVDNITVEDALTIPSVASNTNIISGVIAMLPIYLYKDEGNKKVTKIDNDVRVSLLNDDTKDTLDGFQLKKQLVQDYLLSGNGYAYINKQRNKVESVNYVDRRVVGINMNSDPIFKDYDIIVNGKPYRPFEFIKLLRNTKNGADGVGIVEESNKALTNAYLTQKYQQILLATGGNKKGFLKAQSKLSEEAKTALKTAWNNLYSSNSENVIILNDGIDFKEASSTSVELQMNENRQTNTSEINSLFGIHNGILDDNTIKTVIQPILIAFETAINRDILLESEKQQYYFEFDRRELLKADLLKRYQAYEIGLKNGFIQWDDVRYEENLEPYNLPYIKMGLQDVLYNVETGQIYTPNTNQVSDMGGGETVNESGNQGQ